jgi:hypothetical protein
MNDGDSKRDTVTSGDLTLVVKRARIRVSSGLKTGKCPGVSDPSNGIGCQGGGAPPLTVMGCSGAYC